MPERKTVALERFAQRFDLAGQRLVERGFDTLGMPQRARGSALAIRASVSSACRPPLCAPIKPQYAALSPCVRPELYTLWPLAPSWAAMAPGPRPRPRISRPAARARVSR
ncbi:hypothetical protein LMG29542_08085 [Paraburkholderia humisilvae]|uniref:Uncharacterized protein n=1 Tax=Paraburkholderia humisilvae TaxID=627669 RepID=A0A6J5FB77_9BURK|nr:hypothetical protein LMG29542_08085 [Paraburkholderia humisilvae]